MQLPVAEEFGNRGRSHGAISRYAVYESIADRSADVNRSVVNAPNCLVQFVRRCALGEVAARAGTYDALGVHQLAQV